MADKALRFKKVMRWDKRNRIYRIGRFLWTTGKVGDGIGYSNKLSLSLSPRLFGWERTRFGWYLFFAGARIHRLKSYGGHIV